MSNWITIAIWAGAIALIFGFLWYQGQVQRLAEYIRETREELKKCSWPSWDELKGSTVLIAITILLLGGFTVVVDQLLYVIFYKL